MMTRLIRTMIVDDSEEFRVAFRMMLGTNPKIKIIGEAENGQCFLDMIKNEVPDLVFMDIEMPVMNGIEATREAIKQWGRLKIIALSFHSDFAFTHEMILAGARNYLIKSEITLKEIKEIVETV